MTVPCMLDAPETSAERLRRAVRGVGTVKQVSQMSGVAFGTLNAYLAGGEMKMSNAAALAQATGVRLEWLATGAGPMHASEAGLFEAGGELGGDDQQLQAPGSVLIPRYDVRAAAGYAAPFNEDHIIERVPISGPLLPPNLRRNPAHLALIECMGDSMEPSLRDGDHLLVDTSIRQVAAGPIYILRVGGTLLAKRLQPRLDGTVLVISDNPRYPPETVTPSDNHPLEIVGEVIWRSGPLRF